MIIQGRRSNALSVLNMCGDAAGVKQKRHACSALLHASGMRTLLTHTLCIPTVQL